MERLHHRSGGSGPRALAGEPAALRAGQPGRCGDSRYRCPMDDDAPYRRDSLPELRGSDLRRSGRDAEPIEQRLDRWMSAGRQLVDGVAGGRPGSRPPTRGGDGRGPGRGGFDGLGRWVEERLDWFLEDGDDWREPWQESASRPPSPPMNRSNASNRNAGDPWTQADPDDRGNLSRRPNPSTPPQPPAAGVAPRRRLEALSRRGLAPGPAAAAGAEEGESWPDDDSFSLPRWQRPAASGASRSPESSPPVPDASEAAGRPLPRSSRRASGRV